MPKKILNGSRIKALKVSGFRARNKTKSGHSIINKRRKKKRYRLALTYKI